MEALSKTIESRTRVQYKRKMRALLFFHKSSEFMRALGGERSTGLLPGV